MGELQFRGDVADGVDVPHVGSHVVVNRDGSPVGECDAGRLQSETLHVGRKADGLHHFVGLQLLGHPVLTHRDGDDGPVVGDRLNLGSGADFHTEFLVLLLDLLGNLGVLIGQGARQEFDDRDVDAVVRHEVGELHPDRTGSGDDDGTGQFPSQDLLLVGHHVRRQCGAGNQPGAAAGRDDRVGEGQRLGSARVECHRNGVGIGEASVTVNLGDLVLLHQEMHAGDTAVGHFAAAVESRTEVETHLAADAKGRGLLGKEVREFRVAQQRLGRDAADVEAHPTPVLRFDDRGVQAELGGTNGRDVTAGAGAEDDDVIVSHGLSLLPGLSPGERSIRSNRHHAVPRRRRSTRAGPPSRRWPTPSPADGWAPRR